MQHLLSVTQSTLCFSHVTQNIKQILKHSFPWTGLSSGNAEQWNLKIIKLTNASYLCSLLLWGSLCLLSWWARLDMSYLECPICIIPHSTLGKNSGEACRKLSLWYLSLGKCFSKKLLERQWILKPASCGWIPSPIPNPTLQLPCKLGSPGWSFAAADKVFANHHYQTFLSPVTRVGMS